MKTTIYILFLLALCNICFSQNFSGRWQTQTSEISDAYLGNYLFSKSTFEYTINGYDGLNSIQALGGNYYTHSDTIYFTVTYIKQSVGGTLERSEIYTQNDSWAFEGATIKTVNLTPTVHTVATFKLQDNVLWIDERKFCKLNTENEK